MKARKIAVTAIVLGVFILIAVYRAVRFIPGKSEESALHRHDGKIAVEDGVDSILDSPARSPVDETRKAEIKALCNAVCVAYSNCEYGVIAKFEDELPQVLESLPDDDFVQVTAGVYKLLSSELSGKHTTPHRFDDLENFSSRANTDIAAMRLYGKVCLRRKAGGDMSCRLEALLLRRLTSYREFFAAEGRTEFVRIADEFVSEWICHIESSQGFSRAEALYWLEYSRRWGQDAHGKQEEWAVLRNKAIRQGAKWLVNVGYTPKWIKELEKIENGKDHVQ